MPGKSFSFKLSIYCIVVVVCVIIIIIIIFWPTSTKPEGTETL